MKVMTTKRERSKEVSLTGLLRLPSKPRIEYGLPMKCGACDKKISDEYFLCGFADGHANMLLHEACVPNEDKVRLLS